MALLQEAVEIGAEIKVGGGDAEPVEAEIAGPALEGIQEVFAVGLQKSRSA